MSANNPRFRALFHNEVEKLWAQRARVLIIALLIIVVAGSLLTYHSYQSSRNQAAVQVGQLAQQEARLQSQKRHAHGKTKAAIQRELAQTKAAQKQIQSQSGAAMNVAQQLAASQKSVLHEPSNLRGQTLETIALDKAALAHGIRVEHPGTPTGWGVAGDVFSGMVMLLFGLVAAGLASDRVSSELEGGTWGVLLLHAPRRMRVFWAKLAASAVMTWGFMAATGIGLAVLVGLFVQFGHAGYPEAVGVHFREAVSGQALYVVGHVFHVVPQWAYDLMGFGLAMLAMGVMCAIFLALSLLTRSTIFSLVLGAILVISSVMAAILAHTAGWLALIDPAVHMPLMGDFTGQLAQQYHLASLTLQNGAWVLAAWCVAALCLGLWIVRRMDM